MERNKIEETSYEILKSIFFRKDYSKLLCTNYLIFIILFIVSILIAYYYVAKDLHFSYIQGIINSFVNIYSILIGFSFTAITLVATIFNTSSIKKLDSYKSKLYPDFSIYKTTVLVYFEYIYALIFTLLFMILCILIYPFANFLQLDKLIFSCLFFIPFFMLLAWSIVSIKALIANLYLIIIFRSQIEQE